MTRLTFLLFFIVYAVSSISQVHQWTWTNGDNSTYGNRIYGTKGQESTSNKPCGRYGSIGRKDVSGNFWLFGGSASDVPFDFYYKNDLWKYNITTQKWAWVNGDSTSGTPATYGIRGLSNVSNNPGVRLYSLSWRDALGNLWLFGGEEFDPSVNFYGIMNDLWKYNTDTGEWTRVNGFHAFTGREGHGNLLLVNWKLLLTRGLIVSIPEVLLNIFFDQSNGLVESSLVPDFSRYYFPTVGL